jgi:hypothetical protein
LNSNLWQNSQFQFRNQHQQRAAAVEAKAAQQLPL